MPTDVNDGDFGEVTESLPLLGDVLLVADDDDVFELAEQEVTGPQRHHEVTKTNQRRVGVSEQTDDDVVRE